MVVPSVYEPQGDSLHYAELPLLRCANLIRHDTVLASFCGRAVERIQTSDYSLHIEHPFVVRCTTQTGAVYDPDVKTQGYHPCS